MNAGALHYLSIAELGARLRARQVSSVEVTRAMLERIAVHDPELHSYALVTADLALAQAAAADAAIARDEYMGPLHGVPIAVKDLCFTAGIATAAGTTLHRSFRPDYDATVVTRLRVAGAVLLGKLQMTEGAYGAHHPDIVAPLNPWNHAHWSGVSSSGSGVATAAGLCFASLGSDTGGSIRFPSTMNGVTGLKPTWGRVSRHGVFALAESMDHIGPIARDVADCAIMLRAIAGADTNDPTAAQDPVPDYSGELAAGVRGLTVGIDRARNAAGADADMVRAVEEGARSLASLGATVREISLPPSFDDMARDWMAICAVETALAHEPTYPLHAAAYGPVLKDLIDAGRALPALEVERMRFTAPFDMSGTPTLTLPGGTTAEGMPVGFQIAGPRFGEATVLRAGHAFQQATEWHRRRPPV